MSGEGRVLGLFSWRGATLRVSLPGGQWLARLTDLLGLAATSAPDGEADIRVHDALRLRSFATEVAFLAEADLLIWLSLTMFDVLAEMAGVFLLHAAALEGDAGLVLLSGPPRAGKSTLALAARNRGFAVLGDDVVAVDPQSLTAAAAPRPYRERISPVLIAARELSVLAPGLPLAGRIDGEACRLHPRGATTPAPARPIAGVCFLARHDGAGIRLAAPPGFEALHMLLDHARIFGTPPLPAMARVARLARNDCLRLSVGDGEMQAALDALDRRFGLRRNGVPHGPS